MLKYAVSWITVNTVVLNNNFLFVIKNLTDMLYSSINLFIFSSLFFKNPRILNFEICCIKKLLTAFSFTGFKIAKTAIKMVNAFIPKPSITKDITPSI